MSSQNPSKPQPTHIVSFLVGDEEDPSPIPAGAAWPDGDGYMIQLEAVPLSGLLSMQPHKGRTHHA